MVNLAPVAHWLSNVPYYVSWIALCYLLGFALSIVLKILVKLRTEIFNEDRKIKPSADKVILITGSTAGIGLALAKYFFKRGFSVIVTRHSKREPPELIDLMNEKQKIQNDSGEKKAKLFLIDLNVRSIDSIKESYEKVKKILNDNEFGLFALINNAGISSIAKGQWDSRATINAVVQTNLLGPLLMIRQFAPLLIKMPDSRIVNVGSGLSLLPSPCFSIYGATKSGLNYYSSSLTMDMAPYGVKIVLIHVGNLIDNTSISDVRSLDALDSVQAEFSNEENEIYKEEFDSDKNLLRLHFDKRERETNQVKYSWSGKVMKCCVEILTGKIRDGVQIEDSFTVNSFDNAVCLKNPPNEMFAGNWFFTLIASSFLETLSFSALRDVNLFAAKFNLQRKVYLPS